MGSDRHKLTAQWERWLRFERDALEETSVWANEWLRQRNSVLLNMTMSAMAALGPELTPPEVMPPKPKDWRRMRNKLKQELNILREERAAALERERKEKTRAKEDT